MLKRKKMVMGGLRGHRGLLCNKKKKAKKKLLMILGRVWCVEKLLKEPADSLKRKDIKISDQQIRLFVTNRTSKVKSPESITPTGRSFPKR